MTVTKLLTEMLDELDRFGACPGVTDLFKTWVGTLAKIATSLRNDAIHLEEMFAAAQRYVAVVEERSRDNGASRAKLANLVKFVRDHPNEGTQRLRAALFAFDKSVSETTANVAHEIDEVISIVLEDLDLGPPVGTQALLRVRLPLEPILLGEPAETGPEATGPVDELRDLVAWLNDHPNALPRMRDELFAKAAYIFDVFEPPEAWREESRKERLEREAIEATAAEYSSIIRAMLDRERK